MMGLEEKRTIKKSCKHCHGRGEIQEVEQRPPKTAQLDFGTVLEVSGEAMPLPDGIQKIQLILKSARFHTVKKPGGLANLIPDLIFTVLEVEAQSKAQRLASALQTTEDNAQRILDDYPEACAKILGGCDDGE